MKDIKLLLFLLKKKKKREKNLKSKKETSKFSIARVPNLWDLMPDDLRWS